MKIKDLIKDKITNITRDEFEDDFFEEEQENVDNLVIGNVDDKYVFYVYDCYGQMEEIKEMNLVVIWGHETIIIYNKKTKKFKEIYTR